MGEYLTTPNTTKDSADGETPRLKFASCGMQGWRKNMEDTHICLPSFTEDFGLFGVFDGHGGQHVAVFAKKHFPTVLKNATAFKAKNYRQALIDAFVGVDKLLESEEGKKEIEAFNTALAGKGSPLAGQADTRELANYIGCTACVALLGKTEIYVANAGDSRCVMNKGGIAVNLSEDHKPDLELERRRIIRAGGYVEENRVNGVINLSRSLGDLDYKHNTKLTAEEQMITAVPDIRCEKVLNDTEFLILACDGIWDCMTSQGAVDYIKEQIAKSTFRHDKAFKLSKVLEAMLDRNLASDVEASGISISPDQ